MHQKIIFNKQAWHIMLYTFLTQDSLDEDDDVSHMTPEELFEDFMEKIKSAAKDTDTTRDHYREFYMFPWISPHQSLFDAEILIPCENFYLDLNLLQWVRIKARIKE